MTLAKQHIDNTTTLPPTSHPNYRLWSNYATFAEFRGALVCAILQQRMNLTKKNCLDIGCGSGGTSIALAQNGAQVTALDHNAARVNLLKARLGQESAIQVLHTDAHTLQFPDQQFDLVILQDVIEHLPKPQEALNEIYRVLKTGGLLYFSTPNRWSPLNFISDPHWNLPLVAALPRKQVAFFITQIARREKEIRPDFAALLSLRKIQRLLQKDRFELAFSNRIVAKNLFVEPRSVVNHDLHLAIIKYLKKIKLDSVVPLLVNDKFGLFNYLINPTWYFVAKKR